jgi:hypothetical protein
MLDDPLIIPEDDGGVSPDAGPDVMVEPVREGLAEKNPRTGCGTVVPAPHGTHPVWGADLREGPVGHSISAEPVSHRVVKRLFTF